VSRLAEIDHRHQDGQKHRRSDPELDRRHPAPVTRQRDEAGERPSQRDEYARQHGRLA
jgi:hypothetical protein